MRKTPNNILHIFIHFFIIFFLAYNSVVFQRICRKLVTVRKILKRSLKWDQSGIYSFIRLKDTSKTRLTVKKMGKFYDLYPMKVKRSFTQNLASGTFENWWILSITPICYIKLQNIYQHCWYQPQIGENICVWR